MSADEVPAFRPDVGQLECQDYLKECMRECWAEMPENRPDFRTVRSRLKAMRKGMYVHIMLHHHRMGQSGILTMLWVKVGHYSRMSF